MNNGNGNGGRLGDLSTRAMLVGLEINLWGNRRLDRKVSREVAATYGVGEEAGRYNKWLLIEDQSGKPANLYREVVAEVSLARQKHYELTLPWENEGERITSAENFMHWAAAMREHQNRFNAAFQRFYDEYPKLLARTEQLMSNGGQKSLFDPKNYPTQEELVGKFGFRTRRKPISEARDFRVDLPDNLVQLIREGIEADNRQSITNASRVLVTRLHDVAKRVAHLSDEKSVLRKGLAKDVREVTEIAARLNLDNDPQIDAFCRTIRDELSYNVETLKAIPEERQVIAAKADRIARDMAAYMGV